MSALFVVEFAPTAPFISANQTGHWRTKAARIKTWRTAASIYGYQARQTAQVPAQHKNVWANNQHVTVRSELTFTTNRGRDPHNYYATIKPVIDGLKDAGWWPDDTAKYLRTEEPVLKVGELWIRLELEFLVDPRISNIPQR